MNVLIIEDEGPAAEKLERYLKKYDDTISILARIDNTTEATEWLRDQQDRVDLIFMDIQLKDGLSFQIFQQVTVRKPVIFVTAFNEFALDAFKVNSIDYLLKPITYTDLTNSLKKIDTLREQLGSGTEQARRIEQAFSKGQTKEYKNRFMVKIGDHIRSFTTDQINLLYAEGRDVYLVTSPGRRFIIDYTLEGLEELLDPATFFRVNRTFIVNINAIKDVLVYSNSRLKVSLVQEFEKEIIVSREKVSDFKEWFDGLRSR